MTLQEKAELFDKLKSMMGYVQNGSDTSVCIYQDDATYTYHCKVGKNSYWGNSLKEAINKAYESNPPEKFE